MKKILALLLSIIMTLSLFAGCGDTSSNSGDNDEVRKDVKIAISADPGTLSPFTFGGPDYNKVVKSIYQALGFLTLEKEVQPILAESWEQKDALTYVVKLKENVQDSAGNPITADDVIFSFNEHKNSAAASTWKYNDDETPFEKIGDYEIQLNFKQETSSAFTSILTGVYIVSEKSFKEAKDKFVNMPVGTGPYKLENWIVGSELVLTKNENYWDENPYKYFVQNMDEITYKVISEAAQRAIELETGGVDFVYDTQTSDLERLRDTEGIVAKNTAGTKTLNIYFNCSDNSVFKDKRLRYAVAYAIDSQALATAIFQGYGSAAASIAHPSSIEWRDKYEGSILYDQNIEKAKEYLAEVIADDINPNFHIITDENPTKVTAATIIQEACRQIGIEVSIEQLESATFQARYSDMTAWDAYIGYGGSSALYTMATLVTQIDRTGYPEPSELRDALSVAFTRYDAETTDNAIELWDTEIPILTLAYSDYLYAYTEGLKGADELDFSGMIHPGACSWE